MTMTLVQADELRAFRNDLHTTVEQQADPSAIPLALARAVHAADLSSLEKQNALGFVRDWASYAEQHQISTGDPYAIRYHIGKFSTRELGTEHHHEALQEVDISQLQNGGRSYADVLAGHVSLDILSDPHVAIVGGAARLALKCMQAWLLTRLYRRRVVRWLPRQKLTV